MKVDYSKTIIYKLCCKDTSVKDIYVGATTDMKSRKRNHRCNCNNPNTEGYNQNKYKFIREQGGFINWDMIMIEKYPCKDKLESDKRERYWLEELGATLNKFVPSRTNKEYNKKYREDNKEYTKKYREDNKEKFKQYSKNYREDNKDKHSQRCKIKYTCECGSLLSKGNKARHEKSKKHINFINNQTNDI